MTQQHIRDAEALFQRIEQHGGMLRAVESGAVKQWIQESAYRRQRGIDDGSIRIVGVNCHQNPTRAAGSDAQRLDPALEAEAVQRLVDHRTGRDAIRCAQALTALTQAARGKENLIPFIVEAARADATVGEICAAMKLVLRQP